MPEIVFSRGYKHVKLGILHDGRSIHHQEDNSPLYIFHRKDEPLISLYEKYRDLIVPTEQDSSADMLANETLLDELIDFIMFKSHLTSPVIRQFLYITVQSNIFRDQPQLRRSLSHRSSIECRSLPGFTLPDFSKHSRTVSPENKLSRSSSTVSHATDINDFEARPRSNSSGLSLSSLTKSLFFNPMSKSLPVLSSKPPTLIGSHRETSKPSSSWIARKPSVLQTTSPISIESEDLDSEMSPIQSISPRDTDESYLRTAIPVSPNSLPKYSRSGHLIKKGSPRRKYYDLIIFENCRHENGAFNIKSTCISFQKRIVSKKVSDSLKWKLVIYYDEGFYIPIH